MTVGDLRQQLLVERRRDVEAVDLDHRALLRCRLRSRERGRPRSTRPRRGRADRAATCSRRPRAARSRTSRRSRCRPRRLSLSRADSSIVSGFPAIALSEVKRPWPSDVPPLDREPLDRRDDLLLHVARPEHGDGAVAERDDADLDRPRLLLDERERGASSPPRSGSARDPRRACCSTRRRRGSPCLRDRAPRGSRSVARARSRRGRARSRRARTGCAGASGRADRRSSGRALRTRAGPRARRVGAASTSTRRRGSGTRTSARSIHGEPSDISGAAACGPRRCGRGRVTRSSSVETS